MLPAQHLTDKNICVGVDWYYSVKQHILHKIKEKMAEILDSSVPEVPWLLIIYMFLISWVILNYCCTLI